MATTAYSYDAPLGAPDSNQQLRAQLAEELRAAGFHGVVDGRRRERQRLPATVTPLIVAFPFTILMVLTRDFAALLLLAGVAIPAIYIVGALLERVNRGAGAFVVGLLALAWLAVGADVVRDDGWRAIAGTHVAPLIGAGAVFYARRAVASIKEAFRSVPLLFPVVLIALFIPLFTQELWRTVAELDVAHAFLLGVVAVVPVLWAVRREVCNSVTAAFEAGARRLEDGASKEHLDKEISRFLEGPPRFTRDLEAAVDVLGTERMASLASWLLAQAHPSERDRWRSKMTEAFRPPAPTTYAPRIADRLHRSLKLRISVRLPIFVVAIGGAIAVYIYVLAAIAIDVADAKAWSGAKSIDEWTVVGLSLPLGPYVSVSLFLGIVATAIFLAFVLTEERYSSAVADAIVHRTIERALLLAIPYYYVQAPVNGWFDRAEKLSGAKGSSPGTNAHGNKEPGEPDHAGNAGGSSVWYSWQAPTTGPVAIDTVGSTFDTLLAVYTGEALGHLTVVAANDDANVDGASRVSFDAIAGTVYWIAVDGYRNHLGDVAEGDVVLNYSSEPPPNDSFSNAELLPGSSGRAVGTTVNATRESGEPSYPGNREGNAVWYAWEATVDEEVTFDTTGSEFEALVAVYAGSGLADLEAVNDGMPSSRATFLARSGTAYRIAVYAPEEAAVSAGSLILSYCSGKPSNDHFHAARWIEGPTGHARGANLRATKEFGEPNHAANAGGKSIWYAWEAPATGEVTIDTADSTFDTTLAVYVGDSVDNLISVAENDDVAAGTTTSRVDFEATAGTLYRIAVDGYRDDFGVSDGWIELRWSSPPANDAFDRAQRLVGTRGSVTGMNANATRERDEPDHAGGARGKSVWYEWEAPVDGRVAFTTEGSSFDTVLAVYTGDQIGKLKEVAANDDDEDSLGIRTSHVKFEARAGTLYRIAVDGFSFFEGGAGEGSIVLGWEQDGAPDSSEMQAE